jgi:hypothetical protein
MKTSPRRNPREVYVLKKTCCARRILAGFILALTTLFLAGCAGFSTSKAPSKVVIPGSPTYAISGTINPASAGSGASVTLTGAAQATTKADSSGRFTFNNLVDGAYRLSVSKSGVHVSPSSQPVTVSGANVAQIAFSASVPTFSLSGTISPAAAGSGATVTISGGVNGSTTADSSGNYTFANLDAGSYTVSPSKPGATFSPASQAVSISSANVGQVNFNGTVQTPTYTISGTISPASAGSGATVTLSGDANAVIVSNSSGNFTFGGLSNGSYSVSVNKNGINISPASQAVTVSNANVSQVNFNASLPPTYSISGTISPSPGGSGATVTLSGTANASTVSNGSGNYSFSGLSNGSYTVSVSKSGVNVSPGSQAVNVSNANMTQVNFSATIPTFTISGTISPASSGNGATVTISGGVNASTTADGSGNYSFTNISAGSYTLTPSASGISFSPSGRMVAVSSNLAGINFTASSSQQQSGPIVINGQNGTVIEGLRITSSSGDCVTITNSTNITIQNSEIGPCAGNGVVITGGSGVNVFDSYIHPETQSRSCCDRNDGIYASGTKDLTIQGNVVAYGEDNIQVDTSDGITVVGNFLLNPRNYAANGARGHQFQSWMGSSNVTVSDNYTVSSANTSKYLYAGAVQDGISFGKTNTFSADGNFVNGGQSSHGCAIIADSTTNNGSFTNNLVLDSGDCGIEIASGNHNTMDQNKVLSRNPTPNGQMPVGLSVWASYFSKTGETCSFGTVTNNVAAVQQLDGSYGNGLFAPTSGTNSCAPVTNSGNTLNDAALSILTTPSVSAVFPTPSIPPQPKNCVVVSPYSTQTSLPACVP